MGTGDIGTCDLASLCLRVAGTVQCHANRVLSGHDLRGHALLKVEVKASFASLMGNLLVPLLTITLLPSMMIIENPSIALYGGGLVLDWTSTTGVLADDEAIYIRPTPYRMPR